MTTKATNKGGLSVSALVKLLRKTEAYEAWKRAVFIRDRFTCQQCGKRNGRQRVIEAHHLTGFAKLVRESGAASVDESLHILTLWDINNGQTLCRTCHEKTESFAVNFKKDKASKKNGKTSKTNRPNRANSQTIH